MAIFNPKKLRLDFPILHQANGLIYLDNGATSQRPAVVIDGVCEFYRKYNANVHRGLSIIGENATSLYEQAREKVATFIHAFPEEIVFVRGTTEGLNFVAATWGKSHIKAGDEIVTTQIEHHANLLPWQRLAQEKGAKLQYIACDTNTFSFKENVVDVITDKTKLVAVTHCSNVLDEVWSSNLQLQDVIQKAHKVGAKVVIDAAQSAPNKKIDVKDLDVDFLTFSGHKMLGPTGIGVLYIKKSLHDEVEPYHVGGSMVYEVDFKTASWAEPPAKYEAGTPAIAQAIGLGIAVDYITEKIDFDALRKHTGSLCSHLIDELQKIEGVHIYGNIERLRKGGHLVSFGVDGMHVHDLCSFLSQKNIAVRAGHHCAQPLAKVLGIGTSLRVSFYVYNTVDDVQACVKGLHEAITFFRKGRGSHGFLKP
jgi:cysteine desulfurase/selenocysteine lyase